MVDRGINTLLSPHESGLGRATIYRPWVADKFINLVVAGYVFAVVAASVGAKLIYLDWFLGQPQDVRPYLLPAIALSIALCVVYKHMRLLNIASLQEPVVGFGNVWGGLSIAFLIVLGLLFLLKVVDFYSRGWILTWFLLASFLLVWVRWIAMQWCRKLTREGLLADRIALYGNPRHVTDIYRHIPPHRARHVDRYYAGTVDAEESSGFIGDLEDLRLATERGSYDRIVLGFDAGDKANILSATKAFASFSSELLLCSDLQAYPIEMHGWRVMDGLRVGVINPVPEAQNHRLTKRVMDYTVAVLGLLALTPLFVVVAIAIKLESPGPVFFRQRRYGMNNRVFRIFKFRTMTVTEDGANVRQAQRRDPRVTRVGAVLRATSIDELPQLLNVLLGNMSIVGPRPHALIHDEGFAREIEFFTARRRVLPGLTGWAQVNGFRGETRTVEDIRGRSMHDQYYIQNWSLWFDIEIMVRTVVTLLRGAH